jgi:hypothetical protein
MAGMDPSVYNNAMKTNTTLAPSAAAVLDRLLEPLARSLTPPAARALVGFRIGREDRARVAFLAEKCNDGLLTPSERQEYEAYVRGGDFITILQSKARRFLKQTRKP